MTFVQNQEIKTPENVQYVTELNANYSYKGLNYAALGPACVILSMSCSLLNLYRYVLF